MTNRQKQNLLQYLGYYLSVPDGVWGEKSREATRRFQRDWKLREDGAFGEETEEKIRAVIAAGEPPEPPAVPGWWKDIRYFRREEFRCPCGCCGGFPVEPAEKLVRLAEQVRSIFGAPALVSSGVRCRTHNARVGGVAGSYHLRGKAMDFRVRGETGDALLKCVKALPVHYAYRIDDSFVHMDIA